MMSCGACQGRREAGRSDFSPCSDGRSSGLSMVRRLPFGFQTNLIHSGINPAVEQLEAVGWTGECHWI